MMTHFGDGLYTAEQTRRLDRRIIASGIPGSILMSRAAAAAFARLRQTWPDCRGIDVLCGTGNNGGDGYLIADLAHKRGWRVRVWQVGDPGKLRGDALAAFEQARSNGVAIAPWRAGCLSGGEVVVDAMLGTGLGGEVREPFAAAIADVNAMARAVLAVDIPSGLCSDTGRVLGSAVHANATVTFIARKRGLYTALGPDHSGVLHFDDLGSADTTADTGEADCHLLRLEALLGLLAPRPRSAHKGMYGTVLVIGGDYGMAGAVSMAAESALRCGAGLVRVATRPEHVAALAARVPEVMTYGVRDGQALAPLLRGVDVVIAGPGLGRTAWSEQLLQCAGGHKGPLVLDADALNLLAAGALAGDPEHRILTPHPGEAARLLETDAAAVQADRFAAVRALQENYSGVAVLKGNGTLIADTERCFLSDYGNPGMAGAGMGDVLSGVIGAMLAQGLAPGAAASLGVCLHGRAGDLAAAKGQRGLVATDLMPFLRELLN